MQSAPIIVFTDGRIDHSRLVTAPPNLNEFNCPLCDLIVWKPVRCEKCNQHYCHSCLENHAKHTKASPDGMSISTIVRWFTGNPPKCPNCEEKLEIGRAERFFKNRLEEIEVFCIFKENGCTESTSYGDLARHEANCQFRGARCKGCKKIHIFKELQQHEDSCKEIEIPCEICEKPIKRKVWKNEGHEPMECLIGELKRSKTRILQLENQDKTFQKKMEGRIFNLERENEALEREVKKMKVRIFDLEQKNKTLGKQVNKMKTSPKNGDQLNSSRNSDKSEEEKSRGARPIRGMGRERTPPVGDWELQFNSEYEPL